MPGVKCPMEDCGHRSKRGYCHRKKIELVQTRSGCNELYCLGWQTPGIKAFTEIVGYAHGVIPEFLNDGKKGSLSAHKGER